MHPFNRFTISKPCWSWSSQRCVHKGAYSLAFRGVKQDKSLYQVDILLDQILLFFQNGTYITRKVVFKQNIFSFTDLSCVGSYWHRYSIILNCAIIGADIHISNLLYQISKGCGLIKLSGIENWNVFTKEELLGIFGYMLI